MAAKPVCKYGAKCYRKNGDHLTNYDHKLDEIDTTNENKCPNIIDTTPKKSDSKSKCEDKKFEENSEKYELNSIKDIREIVNEENRMKMPEDFYDLIEFLKTLDSNNPKDALNIIDIRLTGIYDLVFDGLKLNYKLHSRFYYDPPEFQTVLEVTKSDNMLHFGYFRDDPNELPDFVAVNDPNLDCKINCKGDNIFSAICWYIDELISARNYKSDTSLNELKDLKTKLTEFSNTKKYSLQLKTPKIKAREKKINCKTFHDGGLFVKVDSKGFGYREVPETYDSQRKIFTNYCLKDDGNPGNLTKRNKADERIQEIITLIQFANDEIDYGMGLEFGINMFCHGDLALHKFIRSAAVTSYNLLGRELYAEILKEHLKNRKLKIE